MSAEAGESRRTVKTLRLSDAELLAVERRMKVGGFGSFSAYARQVLVDGELRVTQVAYDPRELRSELARIGNNINQIARSVNIESSLAASEAVAARKLMQDVQRLLSAALRQV